MRYKLATGLLAFLLCWHSVLSQDEGSGSGEAEAAAAVVEGESSGADIIT